MESPFARLFKEIQERIASEVPEVKWIDQNLAQYLHEEYRKAMIYPCVLIDFPNNDFTGLQGNIQMATSTILVSLFFDNWNATYHTAPDSSKEAGLNYLEIEQKVYGCLQGYSLSFTTPFVRINSKSLNINEIGLVVKEITFTTSFEDYSLDEDNYVSLGFNTGG